jgi:exodeoxyribonuclease-1
MNASHERIVFLDIETGGLEFTRPIIQLAAVAVDAELRELESVERKVAFDEAAADPQALSANKYDPDVWRREAVECSEAARQFAGFLRRHATFDMFSHAGSRYCLAQLAGHNAERFDGPFLHSWYRRQQVFCPARYMALCTKQKALWLFQEDRTLTPPSDYKLGTLCQYFGVRLSEGDAHDALNDVRATVELYKAMRSHERQLLVQAA